MVYSETYSTFFYRVCFRVLSVHTNIFPLVSKLAKFVNILAKFVFARSYYGNKMAHFVSARKPITIVVIMFPIMSPMISVTDHLRKSESDEYVLAQSSTQVRSRKHIRHFRTVILSVT